MTAVILAAGIASRLRPLTDDVPKCLLRIGEKRILERTIDNLLTSGTDRVVIVTGYRAEQIRTFVRERYPSLDVAWIHNDVYDSTNNIYSLWLAREAAGEKGMLLLDSDILFDARIVGALLTSGHRNCLAMKSDHALGEEEIKVRLDDDARIEEISKTVHPAEAAGESIGIELFSPEFCLALFDELRVMIEDESLTNVFYEAAFERVIASGADVYAVDISAFPSMELDTVADVEAARRILVPLLDG
jgi:choline kinase